MRTTQFSALLFVCTAVAIFITVAGAEPVYDSPQGFITVTNPPVSNTFFTSDRWPAPFAFSFTDSACGAVPWTWHWDFGDGPASDELNPACTYRINGDYTVTLTMTNKHGRVTKTTHITTLQPDP